MPNLRNKEEGDNPTNVASHLQFKRGDVEAGLKAADFVVEREFNTAMVHQGYIEPHNAVGIYNSDGQATIYCSTQGAFDVRSMSAQVLGVSVGKIKVVPAEIGGGFGGKTTIYLEPLSLMLAKKTGHPVKLVMTRGEVLRASGPTSGSKIKIKMGCTRDGKITGAEVWMAYEAGAFPGSPVGAGAMCLLAPYNIDNFQIDGYDVVVNRPKTAAYRAPGATNAAMASETVIDELAEKCGMDPIDFRVANAAKEGTASDCRTSLQADRLHRDGRGDQEQPALQERTEGHKPRTRRGGRILVQRRHAVLGDREYPDRRHRRASSPARPISAAHAPRWR